MLYCGMALKLLGRFLCLVQESYLSKSFSPEADFGVIIVFLSLHFRIEDRYNLESILLAFLLLLHFLMKIPHLNTFFHRAREGEFVFRRNS